MRYKLYMLRCSKKLTKGEMAEKTGVSRVTYGLIENGKRQGNADFWHKVQSEFSIPDEQMYSLMRTSDKEDETCEETDVK